MFFNEEFFHAICNKQATFFKQFVYNMQYPCLPNTLTLRKNTKQTTDGKQPYVKAKVNGYGINFLYDTGASRTCLTMNTFKNVFPNWTPHKLHTNSISDKLYDTAGKSLGCIIIFEMEFEVLG
jgi:hypothetical protein